MLDYFSAAHASWPRRFLPDGWLEVLAVMLLFAAPLLASAVALLVMILEAMRAQDARVLWGAAALGALVLFFLAVEIIAIRIACHRAASRRT